MQSDVYINDWVAGRTSALDSEEKLKIYIYRCPGWCMSVILVLEVGRRITVSLSPAWSTEWT